MPIVPAKCPECGGLVEVDNEKRAGLCQHCGQPFVVEDAIQTFNTYYQTTNNYNTTYNYGDGAVVNVYEDKSKDFVIEAGVLKEYHGESVNVIIPDNVCEIGYEAFARKEIVSITIPTSVIEIDARAFLDCRKLIQVNYVGSFEEWNKIRFANELTSNPNYIAHNLYINGQRIDGAFHIPNGITRISNLALCGCSDLTQVFIPDSVTEIGFYAFADCYKLINIMIPKSVKQIECYAFYRCRGLREIKIPKDIDIWKNAFLECATNQLILPEETIIIKENGGYTSELKLTSQCGETNEMFIKKLIIPNDYDLQGKFVNCYIQELFIGNNVRLHSYSFENCEITKAVIGNNFKANINNPNGVVGVFDRRSTPKQIELIGDNKSVSRLFQYDYPICPICGGTIGFFTGKCKNCETKF